MNLVLDKIPGQQRAKNILNNFLLSGNIPHAFLFSGIEGIGKDNAAIKFAQALVTVENKNDSEKKVRMIEQLSEPPVKFIFSLPRGKNETDASTPMEKLNSDELKMILDQIENKAINPFHKISIPKANSIKINSIRDIKKFLTLNYEEVGYRFIIISDAHLMNEEAQNALLKSLEEPPDKVIFILTTSEISKLRPTILSRCWRVNFDPLSDEQIFFVLTNYFYIDDKVAREASTFAMGSIQTAIKLVDIGIQNLKDKTISLLRYSFGRKFISAFDELNSILSEQKLTAFPILINLIIIWLTDVQKYRLNFKYFYYNNHITTLEKFDSKFPDIRLDVLSSKLDKLINLQSGNINSSLLSANLIFELSSVVLQKQ